MVKFWKLTDLRKKIKESQERKQQQQQQANQQQGQQPSEQQGQPQDTQSPQNQGQNGEQNGMQAPPQMPQQPGPQSGQQPQGEQQQQNLGEQGQSEPGQQQPGDQPGEQQGSAEPSEQGGEQQGQMGEQQTQSGQSQGQEQNQNSSQGGEQQGGQGSSQGEGQEQSQGQKGGQGEQDGQSGQGQGQEQSGEEQGQNQGGQQSGAGQQGQNQSEQEQGDEGQESEGQGEKQPQEKSSFKKTKPQKQPQRPENQQGEQADRQQPQGQPEGEQADRQQPQGQPESEKQEGEPQPDQTPGGSEKHKRPKKDKFKDKKDLKGVKPETQGEKEEGQEGEQTDDSPPPPSGEDPGGNHRVDTNSAFGDVPAFSDKDRGAGYSIDYSDEEIKERLVKLLISKFVNSHFRSSKTDLNTRSHDLTRSHGFQKWDVPKLVRHKTTKQYPQMLNDKYGYEYEQGKEQTIPLSFYFDLSGSMSRYSKILSQIAYELLRSGVKVLIGFNESIQIQIDEIDKSVTKEELFEFITGETGGRRSSTVPKQKIKSKPVNQNLDTYLIDKKAEKCIVFSDFDAATEISNLSQHADVYWMCFRSDYTRAVTSYHFNGFIAKTLDEKQILETLEKFNSTSYKTLRFKQREEMGLDTQDESKMSKRGWQGSCKEE